MDSESSYQYYSRRPIDERNLPTLPDNPLMCFYNYDEYERVPSIGREAWGEFIYRKPLTRREIEDYELIPSPTNPDLMAWMEEQAQSIGKREDEAEIPGNQRLTWWISSRGMYLFKPSITPEQVAHFSTAPHPRKEPGQGKRKEETRGTQVDSESSYQYYSRRPIDERNLPNPPDNPPIGFYKYDEYKSVPSISREAWGELMYRKPLPRKEIEDYELIPFPSNPDRMAWREEQAQSIGKREDETGLPCEQRLTEWSPFWKAYIFKPTVTPEQIENLPPIISPRQRKGHGHDGR